MKIIVNGVEIPQPIKLLDIQVQVDQAGETLPPAIITVGGGKLDVYRSKVTTAGNISIHMLTDE